MARGENREELGWPGEGAGSSLATSWASMPAHVPGPQCGYCPCWPRERAQWGLCPSSGKPVQLGGVPPRQLGSEGRHFLSPLRVFECSERQGEGRGRAGGLLRQAPICVPRGGLPSWGMRRERDSRAEAGLTPGLSPSPLTRLLRAGAVRRLAGPLALPRRPSTPLPLASPRAFALAVPCARNAFPWISTSFVPCFKSLFPLHLLKEACPATLSEHDLTPQHLFLGLYSLSPHSR